MAIDDFGVEEPKKEPMVDRNAIVSKNNHMFLNVFTSPDGEQVLRDMMVKFYKYTSHVPGDSHQTAFKEGQRQVVIYILDRLEKAEKNYEGLDGEST